jgi:hypothetical protein
MSFSERIYRFLLRAYLSDYRSRYAELMEQLFRDRLRKVHAFADLAALWGRTLADWAVSLPASYWGTPDTRFSSLADSARRCIFFSRFEASSFSRSEVTIEHLLLGVLRQEPALVPGVALEAIMRTIESTEPAGWHVLPMRDPHAHPHRLFPAGAPVELSEEAIRVVAAATEIAHTAGRQKAVPADLAAGILREAETLAARLLREHISDRV